MTSPLEDALAQKVVELELELEETYRSVLELTNEVEDQQERFSRMEAGLQDEYCFISVDLQGKLLSASPSFHRVYGYPDIGVYNAAIDALTEHPVNDDRDVYWAQLLKGESPPPREWELREPNGDLRRIEATIFPVRDARNQIRCFEGLVRNITSRRQEEFALLSAREKAEHGVRAKSQFLSLMSHELRTPLNGVLGYVQLLQQRDDLPGETNNFVDAIERCGMHLLTLINRVLDFSKLENKDVELQPDTWHLPTQLKDIYDITQHRTKDKGLWLHWELPDDLPEMVEFDATKFKQVLINLIDNALKFTSQGGVTLSVTREGQRWRFAVQDTGPGIDEAHKEMIFAPFRQGEAGEIFGGTGLGLAISRHIIDAMGGELQVESTPGEGSTFWFTLPLKALDPTTHSHQTNTQELLQALPGTKEFAQVLVIDDDDTNRDVLRHMLERIGLIVYTAASGEEGLVKWKAHKPHVILLDLRMPGLDGFQTATKIRASQEKQPVLIAISASVSPKREAEAREVGCQAFLRKPIGFQELHHLLQKHLPNIFVAAAPSAPVAPPTEAKPSTVQLTQTGAQALKGMIHLLTSCLNIGDYPQMEAELQNDTLLRHYDPSLHQQLLQAAQTYQYEAIVQGLAHISQWLTQEEEHI